MQGFIELSNRYIKTEDDQMRCASLTLLTYTIRHMGRGKRILIQLQGFFLAANKK